MSDDKKKDDKKGGIVSGVSEMAEGAGDLLNLGAVTGGGTDEEGEESAPSAGDHLKHAGKTASNVQKQVEKGSKLGESARKGEGMSALTGFAAEGAARDAEQLSMMGRALDDDKIKEAAKAMETVAKGAAAAQKFASGAEKIVKGIKAMDAANAERTRRVRYDIVFDGSEANWTVMDMALREALSEPYEAVVTIACSDTDVDVTELIGKNVDFIWRRGNEPDAHARTIRGLVRAVEEGGVERGHITGKVWIVPALWALGLGKHSRIFQNKSAPVIVEEVLNEFLEPYGRQVELADIDPSDYQDRVYCVQFRESHLDFVLRLLAEEGIGFYFDHAEDDDEGGGSGGRRHEKLVFFDSVQHYPEVRRMNDQPVPFDRSNAPVAGVEPITRLTPRRQLTIDAVQVADYDYKRGTRANETPGWVHNVQQDPDSPLPPREDYAHDPILRATADVRFLESDARWVGTRRFDAFTRSAATSTGVGLVIGFAPGRAFELSGHTRPGGDGDYVITRVSHSSRNLGSATNEASVRGANQYQNEFDCAPKATLWRPEPRDKPRVRGALTATVVGPAGQEIYTDSLGRIKLRFPWDPHGEYDDQATCWVRVSQAWAGHTLAGFSFIPRTGMEVIVTFIDGDPDRPLVTGAVYNQENQPASEYSAGIDDPGPQTRSWIRTRSTLDSEGYNELSFEDEAGSEEVHLRAERNLRELVQNDHSTHVENNQSNTVDVNQTETVGNNQTMTVKKDRTKTVKGDEKNTIEKNRRKEVWGDETIVIGDGSAGDRHTTISKDETLIVRGKREVTVTGGINQETHTQARSTTIRGGDTLTVSTGNRIARVEEGAYGVWASERLRLAHGDHTTIAMENEIHAQSGGHITLQGGNGLSTIVLGDDGSVSITAATQISLKVGDDNEIKITQSSIEIQGLEVKINSSAGVTDINASSQVKIKC